MRNNLFFTFMVIAIMSSCTPESARTTKAVVLDNKFEDSVGQYHTKLAYLSYGVVDYIYSYVNYDAGDTIFVHDPFWNREMLSN
jgi:hypothetical protein